MLLYYFICVDNFTLHVYICKIGISSVLVEAMKLELEQRNYLKIKTLHSLRTFLK